MYVHAHVKKTEEATNGRGNEYSKKQENGAFRSCNSKLPGNLVLVIREKFRGLHHLCSSESYLPPFLEKCVYCSDIPCWDILLKFWEDDLCSETRQCISCHVVDFSLLFFSLYQLQKQAV